MKQKLIIFIIMLSIFPVAAAELPPQQFSAGATLTGKDARITMPSSQTFGDSPVSALNLYFNTPYNGNYKFVITKFGTYSPSLNGTKTYFSISPQLSIKDTSSIEINSATPVDVYQLYDDGWHRLPVQVFGNAYRAQVSSLGVFAVTNGMPLQVNQVKAAQPTSLVEKIEQKDWEIYNNTVIPFFNALAELIRVMRT